MLPITLREMTKAWRENMSASQKTPRNNPHRLLLFYAVECGLKAILMRRYGRNGGRTDTCAPISDVMHNINRLLDKLHAGGLMNLPNTIRMQDIRDARGGLKSRTLGPGEINQMWRYGGTSLRPSDGEIEDQLIKISRWIERELVI